jgi:hypothetical protein
MAVTKKSMIGGTPKKSTTNKKSSPKASGPVPAAKLKTAVAVY